MQRVGLGSRLGGLYQLSQSLKIAAATSLDFHLHHSRLGHPSIRLLSMLFIAIFFFRSKPSKQTS